MKPRSAARAVTEVHGEKTPFESESSGDGREEEYEDGEGEIISPPHSPPPESLLLLGDLFGWLTRIPARARQATRPRADAGAASSLPSQLDLALVCSFWLVVCSCAADAWVAYLPSALLVPLPPLVAGATASVTVGSSASGSGDVQAPFKRPHPRSFLPSSSRYACGIGISFKYFGTPDFEGNVVLMTGTTPY
jgi:hypothetical protein